MMKLLNLGLYLGLILSQAAFGAEFLDIKVDEVKVYSSPDPNSEIISTLLKGDSVPVSPKSPGGFKKVLITDSGKKKIGFIKNTDLGGQSGNLRKGNLGKARTLVGRTAYGFSGGLNYQYQGAREYSNGEGSAATISVLQGMGVPIGGAFSEFSVGKTSKLRAYIEYKSVAVTGSATYKQSATQAAPTDTSLKENFVTIGGMLKFYGSPSSSLWWGGGGQIDKGLSGEIRFGSYTPVVLTGSDLPNFFYTYLAAGVDMPFSAKVFLVPDLRIGAIINTSPLIIECDLRLGLAFKM